VTHPHPVANRNLLVFWLVSKGRRIGDRILRLAPVTNLQTSISSCTLQPARLINLRVPLLPRPPACAEGRFFRFSRSLHPYGLRLGMNLRFRSFTPSSGLRLRTLLRASPELVSSGQVGSDSPTSIEYSSLACTSDEPSDRRSRSVDGAPFDGVPPVSFLAPQWVCRPPARIHVSSPMTNCCSHGTFRHFSLQSSHLKICYFHQDLH